MRDIEKGLFLTLKEVMNEDLDKFMASSFYDIVIEETKKRLKEYLDNYLIKLLPMERTHLARELNKKKQELCPEDDEEEVKKKLKKIFEDEFEKLEKENNKRLILTKWEVVKNQIAKNSSVKLEDAKKFIEAMKKSINHLFNTEFDPNLIDETIGEKIEEVKTWLRDRSPTDNVLSLNELFVAVVKDWIAQPILQPPTREFFEDNPPLKPEINPFQYPAFHYNKGQYCQIPLGGGSNMVGGRRTRSWEVRDPKTGEVLGSGSHRKEHSEAERQANEEAKSKVHKRYQQEYANAQQVYNQKVQNLNEKYAEQVEEWNKLKEIFKQKLEDAKKEQFA